MSALWIIIGLVCLFLTIFVEGRSELGDARMILSGGFAICALVCVFVFIMDLTGSRRKPNEDEELRQWSERLEKRTRGGRRR